MNDFFAKIYELFAYFTGFSNDLFHSGVYVSIGILMLTISAVGMFLYYYLVNHPRFNRWWQWLLSVGLLAVINFAIAYFKSDGVIWGIYEHTIPYPVIYFVTFSMINAFWSAISSFLFSMALKWGSRNCTYTPF